MNSLLNFHNGVYLRILVLILTSGLLLNLSCSGDLITRTTSPPDEMKYKISEAHPYLKLHMKNGDIYVLSPWEINNELKRVTGTGSHMDLNRQILSEGEFDIPMHDVILVETNKISGGSTTGILLGLTFLTGIIAIGCMIFPKACFGSCPTFYAGDGSDYVIQAEGFSSSIFPSLEKADVDALYHVKPASDKFIIQLKNEAYETHVIRSAKILALPKPPGGRVFSTPDGDFYQAKKLFEAAEAIAAEGDCSEKLCSFDGKERFSPADSIDLAEKEIIELTFKNIPEGDVGLVIASRQTLLTTFLFYQTLAYMGTKAGEWIALFERNSNECKTLLENTEKTLGAIDVLIQKENGEWEKISEVGEKGPIATDIKMVPLKNIIRDNLNGSQLKVKLRMAKGLWRIDYTALAEIGNKVDPVIINPSDSYPEKTNSSKVIDLLNNPDSLLVTLPGDEYLLSYQLPPDFTNYELFLESRGYYLEWMRNEWLNEENPAMLYKMFLNPKQYYKDLAPQFKKIEAFMEETFWSSKYVYP